LFVSHKPQIVQFGVRSKLFKKYSVFLQLTKKISLTICQLQWTVSVNFPGWPLN
jgi:hypothetical protein